MANPGDRIVGDYGALVDRVLAAPRQPFTYPGHQYSSELDALFVYTQNVPTYRKRIDHKLTVLLSARDQSVAGFIIYEVKGSLFNGCAAKPVTVGRAVEDLFRASSKYAWELMPREMAKVRDAALC